MSLEDNERSETSQLPKETDCMTALTWSVQGSQSQRERGELQATGGGGMREFLFNGDGVSA